MIDPQKDRLNFGESLRPPIDYALDLAIGTTYNLDMEALLFLPVALFEAEDWVKSDQSDQPLLRAITQVPEKVLLFHQSGKIKEPNYYSHFFPYWEQSLIEVKFDSYDKSFHPKIWLVRYVHKQDTKKVKYKFICSSRNLTMSLNWDIAVSMEALVDKKNPKNDPLVKFLEYLNKKGENRIPKNILDEVSRLDFSPYMDGKEYNFYPIIEGKGHPLTEVKKKVDALLIISPFLELSSMKMYTEMNKSCKFFSTVYELCRMGEIGAMKERCYMFNPSFERDYEYDDQDVNQLDKSEISSDDSEEIPEFKNGHSLHSKLYITESGNRVNWYIGSANCTPSASLRNVEFLTEISGTSDILDDVDTVVDNLIDGKHGGDGIFKEFDTDFCSSEDTDEADRNKIRKLVYNLTNLKIAGKCQIRENGNYDVIVNVATDGLDIPTGMTVKFTLLSIVKLSKTKLKSASSDYRFEDLEIERLTPYLAIDVIQDNKILTSFVRKFLIDLPEGRMRSLLKLIFANRKKFMKYLGYLLSKEDISNIGPVDIDLLLKEMKIKSKRTNRNRNFFIPIYEKLLVALSRDPEAIRQVIKLVNEMEEDETENDEKIVDDKLKNLLLTFEKTLPDEY